MKRIWSPWRMKFVQSREKPSGCIFCDALKRAEQADSLVVKKGKLAFVILNRYPYTSGHLMIVPNVHKCSYEDLDPATRAELMELINHATRVLRRAYAPEGFNVGANLGAAAGAGIAAHVHFHVVPRWMGDANFMSTVGEVRVLPEELTETLARLKEAWDK
jgi:ATP adenylyltransferase